MLMSDYNKSRN